MSQVTLNGNVYNSSTSFAGYLYISNLITFAGDMLVEASTAVALASGYGTAGAAASAHAAAASVSKVAASTSNTSAQAAAAAAAANAGATSYRYGGVASGTPNAIAISATPALSTYATGMQMDVIILSANTGSTVANVDGRGDKSVLDSDGNALRKGALPSGQLRTWVYDGTAWRDKGIGAHRVDLPGRTAAAKVQRRTTDKNWLDDTERWATSPDNIDTGYSLNVVSVVASAVSGPYPGTDADRMAVRASSGEHYIQARRGNTSTYVWRAEMALRRAAGSANALVRVRSDTHNHGAEVHVDLTNGSTIKSSAIGTGAVVSTEVRNIASGWYQVMVAGAMSANTTSVGVIAAVHVLNGARAQSFAGGAEALDVWGLMLTEGLSGEGYVPNVASTGQTYGFAVREGSYDFMTVSMETDTIVNFEPPAAGETRTVMLEITNKSAYSFKPLFAYASTNAKNMTTEPTWTSQATGLVTRVAAEMTAGQIRYYWEEIS